MVSYSYLALVLLFRQKIYKFCIFSPLKHDNVDNLSPLFISRKIMSMKMSWLLYSAMKRYHDQGNLWEKNSIGSLFIVIEGYFIFIFVGNMLAGREASMRLGALESYPQEAAGREGMRGEAGSSLGFWNLKALPLWHTSSTMVLPPSHLQAVLLRGDQAFSFMSNVWTNLRIPQKSLCYFSKKMKK